MNHQHQLPVEDLILHLKIHRRGRGMTLNSQYHLKTLSLAVHVRLIFILLCYNDYEDFAED